MELFTSRLCSRFLPCRHQGRSAQVLSSSRVLSFTFDTYVLYLDGRNAFDGSSFYPPGEQSSLCFDVPTIRELMAVEGHEPVKRKVSAVLCRWSTNFAPVSILPSSISTTLIEQTALKPDPCSRACNWNGRSACLHVYVVHVAVKAVWLYLALGAVASSFFLVSGGCFPCIRYCYGLLLTSVSSFPARALTAGVPICKAS